MLKIGEVVQWNGKKYTIVKIVSDDIIQAEPLDEYKDPYELLFKNKTGESITNYIYIEELEEVKEGGSRIMVELSRNANEIASVRYFKQDEDWEGEDANEQKECFFKNSFKDLK